MINEMGMYKTIQNILSTSKTTKIDDAIPVVNVLLEKNNQISSIGVVPSQEDGLIKSEKPAKPLEIVS